MTDTEIAFELLIIPARDDILKKDVLLCFVHNDLSTCHPCNSRRDIARLALSSIHRCVSITA